ncbi:extracellular solute-binding protein [Burkholderia stabilis]|uniref:extracellular solute-binding protein n=1 Tax=Burkholderia stabilis TaxID=95485 RepID=UPI0009F33566|nr:ABC transporter substrate-binding protein [Burkholderia stabilis]HDR9496427.1 ABC transporter substrate-binding protein [Burkholderia stabilis]HDR9522821.1 ABC transporter substrate-binding protein [Burkholderia stabilis]HDR9539891.1 ABC transporter substrate-binding protein [Burkholderia stabilis]HDR9542986.1 ABC transporter substrate-binding protein [Burkholderia stabilis]
MTVLMLHARRARETVARGARGACAAMLVYCAATACAAAAPAIAQFGQPKYPAGFTHFAYAAPDAPDDGTLDFQNYSEAQSYDSLNPFLVRGSPAPDILHLMFDTLMQRSWDELATEYALIADDVQVAPDGMSATFHIDPAARFSNGDPITPADVKYSFDTLSGAQASPLFNAQFAVIRRAVVVDAQSVRFDFRRPARDAALIAGDLPVFSPKWGMRADGTRPPFDQIATAPPIASGPYLIEQRKNDKQIVYVRNPRYWAANLPSRRGMYRFARVSFKLYLDQYTMLEAFKAGDIDARVEYSATQWARRYVGRNFRNGMLKQGEFPDGPAQMQGFLINLRKPQFADVRVRHALTLAFDYDWMNRMMFYGQYRRTDSFWAASPFGAKGMPGERELALLAPYRTELPPEVFGPMVRQPSTLPPGSLRENLKQARDLLAQAGWHFRDGALRDADGTPMTIEIIDDQPGMDRLILPYIQALGTLGIRASLHELDSALYQRRLDNFQYDMTSFIYPPVTIPGVELARRFGSAAALEVGAENYPGVRSKAVDALIRAAFAATTLDDLETAMHALDRVLINLYILVPHYYLPNARIAYKATYGHPAVVPDSYSYEDWIISYWYRKKPAGDALVSGT